MKKIIFITVITLSTFCFGQLTKFSIEASLPLPIGNNFIGKNYNGVADLGIKYRIQNLVLANIGFSLDGSLLQTSQSGYGLSIDDYYSYKVNALAIEPRIYTELNMKKITRFHPSVGLGYSFLLFNVTSATPNIDSSTFKKTQSGVNVNLGLAFDFTKNIYMHTQYDYIVLTNTDSNAPKTTYNTNVTFLKFGLGVRF